MNRSTDIVKALAASSVFSNLAAVEIRALAARCAMRELVRGEAVFTAHERADRVWLVVSGIIRTSCSYNRCEPTLIDVFPVGMLFGLLDGVPNEFHSAQAAALTQAKVIAIPSAAFHACLARHPAAAAAVIDLLALRLKECHRLRALAQCDGRLRLLGVLLWLRDRLGDEIPLTRQLIAEAVVMRRETTIRLMSPMEKKGWIKTRRGIVSILAPREIERAAAGG